MPAIRSGKVRAALLLGIFLKLVVELLFPVFPFATVAFDRDALQDDPVIVLTQCVIHHPRIAFSAMQLHCTPILLQFSSTPLPYKIAITNTQHLYLQGKGKSTFASPLLEPEVPMRPVLTLRHC